MSADPMPAAPSDEQAAQSRPGAPADTERPVESCELVEDVSIDGMCGVY